MSRIRARYGPAVVLGSIVLLAFAARLAWTLWTAPVPPHLSDPEYYNATALSLARRMAQQASAAAFPDTFIQNTVGTRYEL